MELRDLELLEFDLARWVRQAKNLDRILVRAKGRFEMMPLFGHVFVGFDSIQDHRWREHLVSDVQRLQAPAFKCPTAWTMAKILARLGAFSSIGDAARNGWGFKSEPGWEDHRIRIAKLKGIITIVTPTDIVMSNGTF